MNKTPDVDAVPNFQLAPPEISDEFFQTQTENLPEKDDTLRRLDDQNLDLLALVVVYTKYLPLLVHRHQTFSVFHICFLYTPSCQIHFRLLLHLI